MSEQAIVRRLKEGDLVLLKMDTSLDTLSLLSGLRLVHSEEPLTPRVQVRRWGLVLKYLNFFSGGK